MDVIRVKGQTGISLFRGDTKDLTLCVKQGGEEVLPEEIKGMRATLTVRDGEKHVVLQRETLFDAPFVTLHFSHDETKSLAPGRYDYDIELRREDASEVVTLFRDHLRVLPDVTYEGGAYDL